MTTRHATLYLLALCFVCSMHGALAQTQDDQELDVRCGDKWVTFPLPGIAEQEREDIKAPLANAPLGTLLTIPKEAVRNVIYYSDTEGGEVVFFLETGSNDRPRIFYSGLVTKQVYLDVVSCLD